MVKEHTKRHRGVAYIFLNDNISSVLNKLKNLISAIPAWGYWLFCLMVLLPSLFQFVGQDSCFYINGFKDFLDHPASCMFEMQWYLFFVTGSLLGLDTIIKAKIAGITIVLILWILGYYGLRKDVAKTPLCIGLTLSALGVYGAPIEMSYNHVSILMLLPASILIVKSLDNKWLALAAGVIIGISYFLRFPNLSLTAIGFAPLCVCILGKKDSYVTVKKSLIISMLFVLGCVSSCIVIYLLMVHVGHWELFVSSVWGSLKSASDVVDTENASIVDVLLHAVKCYVVPLAVGVGYLLGLYICDRYSKFLQNKMVLVFLWIVSTIVFYFISRSALMIYEMFILPIFIYAWFKVDITSRFRVWIILALVMLYFYPIGSSSVMSFSGPFTFWLALPLTLICIDNMPAAKSKGISNIFLVVLLSVVAAIMLKNVTFQTYSLYKDQNRFASIYGIDSEAFRYQHVDKNSADNNNEVIRKFKPYIPDNTPLVVNSSIMHAALCTRSFGVSESWIMPNRFKTYLTNAFEEQNEYPWILGTETFYEQIIDNLVNHPEYQIVEENGSLKLYKPTKSIAE